MGRLDPETGDGRYNIEFEFTAVPPSLRLSVYAMGEYRSKTLRSQRFDFKARAHDEDLESRRDWHPSSRARFLGDVFALHPLEMRG